MFEVTRSETAPLEAWVVELDSGEPAVGWGEEYRPAARGPVLPRFLELAGTEGEELARKVVSFVQRHGPLELCEAHGLYWADQRHGGGFCRPVLRPEPLPEWQYWSVWARHALGLAEAARVAGQGRESVGEALEALYERRGWSRARALRAIEREGRGLPDPDGEWSWRAAYSESILQIINQMPDTPEKAWELVNTYVGYGLRAFASRVGSRPGPEGIRLELEGGGVLGRMFLELAQEIAGSGSLAWCDECGRPHGRERAPKRGHGCYCSGRCRKRAHARRRRAR